MKFGFLPSHSVKKIYTRSVFKDEEVFRISLKSFRIGLKRAV